MISLRITFTGQARLQRALEKIKRPELGKPVGRFLVKAGLLVLADAAQNQIARGGQFAGAGGKLRSSPPLPDRLTSRTGELRRSLGQSRGIDRGGLPAFIEFGSDLVYALLHELGLGRFPRRAFLEPALDAVSPRFPDMLGGEIEGELAAA